jgi:hypothetical protein
MKSSPPRSPLQGPRADPRIIWTRPSLLAFAEMDRGRDGFDFPPDRGGFLYAASGRRAAVVSNVIGDIIAAAL